MPDEVLLMFWAAYATGDSNPLPTRFRVLVDAGEGAEVIFNETATLQQVINLYDAEIF